MLQPSSADETKLSPAGQAVSAVAQTGENATASHQAVLEAGPENVELGPSAAMEIAVGEPGAATALVGPNESVDVDVPSENGDKTTQADVKVEQDTVDLDPGKAGGPDATGGETEVEPPLTPELAALRQRIHRCLAYYFHRPEDTAHRSPWGVMHALIGYGVDTEVYVNGRKVNAIGWLCWNGQCRGMRLFSTRNGQLQVRNGPGLQGHEGQFLAMLAQSRVRSDYPIKVDGYEFTINDLIEYEKLTCESGTELTFKLIGLVHYLDSNATWRNRYGENWSIPKLIKEELAQPVIGAACGGTHRMMGFSYAVRKREQRGEPLEGQWLRAKKYVDAYHEYTFKLQNFDGSFSTNWFKGRGDSGDMDRRLETTGHILEWLVYSLPQDQLRDPRVVKSVDYLTNLLLENSHYGWEVGPKGHGLHALVLFDERVFGAKPGQRALTFAREVGGSSQRR